MVFVETSSIHCTVWAVAGETGGKKPRKGLDKEENPNNSVFLTSVRYMGLQ